MNSLKKQYQKQLEKGLIKADPEQAKLVDALQSLADNLQQKRFFWQSKKPVKGVFVWGKVGRGKTYMMDLFFESLPFTDKLRSHFHRFMLDVHTCLKKLEGHSNPLKAVAKQYAKKARVLCFDEFVVEDITDAMILGNFFRALFAEGVTLVATSNTAPHHLYWNGLQRALFLPCIKSIEQNASVFHLRHPNDYRRQQLTDKGVYFTPLDKAADAIMQQAFSAFARGAVEEANVLTVDHRKIKTLAASDNTVWFDFPTICNVPRCKRDYLLLSDQYENFLVSHVKQLKPQDEDLTRNFINLVDVLYDSRKKLIISAEVPIEQLYPEGRFEFEFKRIISRLIEMQSVAYLQGNAQL